MMSDNNWKVRFLDDIEVGFGVMPVHASDVRVYWSKMCNACRELPLPVAHKTVENDFQFAWSYASVLLEIDIQEDGLVYWFAKDRCSGSCVDGLTRVTDDLPPSLLLWLERVSAATPEKTIVGERVVSAEGAHCKVTEYQLSDEAKKALQVTVTLEDLGEVK